MHTPVVGSHNPFPLHPLEHCSPAQAGPEKPGLQMHSPKKKINACIRTTSQNDAWVCGYVSKCIKVHQSASKCIEVHRSASKCFTMFQTVVEETVHMYAKKKETAHTLNAHTTVGIRATAGAIALFAGGPHTISHFLATPHCCVGKRAQKTVKTVKTVKVGG